MGLDKIQNCMNSSDISSFIESKSLILEADTTQSSAATTTVITSVPTELTTTTTSTAAVDKDDSDSNNIQIQITSSTSSVKNEIDHSHDSADDHDVGVTKQKIQDDGAQVSPVGIFFGILLVAIVLVAVGFGYKKYRDNRYRNQEFL